MRPLIRKIEQAFVNRPAPSGTPWGDLVAATSMFGEAGNSLAATIAALNGFNAILAESSSSDEAVNRAVSALEAPLDDVLEAFRKLWERPFPPGLEQGQFLVSAMLERPLRQLLAVLEQVVMAIDDPAGAAGRYGTASMDFTVVFQADEEAQRFEEWCGSVKPGEVGRPVVKGFGLGSLLAAFLLGHWWHGHDK